LSIVCIINRSGVLHSLHSFPTRRSSDLARFSAIERYSANTTCKVRRLSRPLVSGSEPLSTERIKDAIGPTNASGIHMLSRRAEKDRKSTRLNSSHVKISYAVFCLKKKKT